jgi:hypothetical protein
MISEKDYKEYQKRWSREPTFDGTVRAYSCWHCKKWIEKDLDYVTICHNFDMDKGYTTETFILLFHTKCFSQIAGEHYLIKREGK